MRGGPLLIATIGEQGKVSLAKRAGTMLQLSPPWLRAEITAAEEAQRSALRSTRAQQHPATGTKREGVRKGECVPGVGASERVPQAIKAAVSLRVKKGRGEMVHGALLDMFTAIGQMHGGQRGSATFVQALEPVIQSVLGENEELIYDRP